MKGWRCGVVLACCAVLAPGRGAHADGSVPVHYAGYAHGLNLFDVDLAASLRPADYRLQLSFRLVGVLGALIHADGSTVVDGRFAGTRAMPREAFSSGRFRGVAHVTQIDWSGDQPRVTQMQPPAEPDREPVPPEQQAQTIDTLSAIAALLHQVDRTGACDTAARTYDGARLTEFSARTVGEEVLPPTGRSSFQGPALRCDVTAVMVGGFMKDADQAALRKPKHGTAWLARLQPGEPMLPVRITFYDAGGSPSATMYVAPPSDPAG